MASRNTKRDLLLRYHREEQIKLITKWVGLVASIVTFAGALFYTWWKVSHRETPAAAAPAAPVLAKPTLSPRDLTTPPAAPPKPKEITEKKKPSFNLDEAMKKYTGEDTGKPAKINLEEAMKKYTGDDSTVAASQSPVTGAPAAATTLTAANTGLVKLDEKRPAIEKLVQDFFAATTVEARILLVRKPKTIRPYMEEYYARPGVMLPKLEKIVEMRPLADEKRVIALITVVLEGGKEHKFAAEEKDGAWLLDWEGMVNYSALSWKDFQANKPKQSIAMRVLGSSGDFYLGNYTDKLKWCCVELTHPFEEGTVYGYFSRTDPGTASLLGLINATNTEKMPLVLDLFYEENSRPNQVMIRSLVNSRWLPMD